MQRSLCRLGRMVEIQMHWVTDLLVLANLQPAALCVCVRARST